MMNHYEQTLLKLIDTQIESATDDELFAGGYLRDHISLAAVSCEEDAINSVDELKRRIIASLEQSKTELSPSDQAIVMSLWDNLQRKADLQ